MDELSKSIPGAEGMVEAEQGANRKQHNEFCLNCGTKLADAFCHHCGQKDIPRRQTLGELWMNFISSFWSYEGKFFLTTRYLMTRPGFLAMEYNAGRRESYYHPARMYAFISFVFFLIFFSLPEAPEQVEKADKGKDTSKLEALAKDPEDANLDSIFAALPGKDSSLQKVFAQPWADSLKATAKKKKSRNISYSLSKSDYRSVESYDSAELAKPEAKRDGWFNRKLTIRSIELNNRYGKDGNSFGKEFGKAFTDNFSKVLFFLLPVFALVLKMLYIRKDYFYSEHLVFSIYYYNFFYLAGSLQMLLNLIPQMSWVPTVIGFWIFFYLLFAMKRMYKQSWRKTILKFFLFAFVFSFLASIGFGLNAFVILLIL